MREGDLIIGLGGREISSIDQLHQLLTEERIGEDVPLTVIRGTEKLEISITPGEALRAAS
jgi:S1-C subfamily serine protease